MARSKEDVCAALSSKKIRKLYDLLSPIYDLLTRYESGSLRRAIDIADVEPGFKVLEVGFGTGRTLPELIKRAGEKGGVHGLDISPKMTERASRKIKRHGLSERVHLVIGDAENLPFSDSSFNLVFSSYLLDLVDAKVIPNVLSEFKRVLRPDGRLVIVSLSRGSKWWDNMRPYEWIYEMSPSLLGGCRPISVKPYIAEAGFKSIHHELIHSGHLMPTEITLAKNAHHKSTL